MAESLPAAFPDEVLCRVQNAEDVWEPEKTGGIAGAWRAEWLCPSGGSEWNVRVDTETYSEGTGMLTIRWMDDHAHVANWGHEAGDPDLQNCKAFLAGIFAEAIWHVRAYREDKPLAGRMLAPHELESFLAEQREQHATHCAVKSWRGTYDGWRGL